MNDNIIKQAVKSFSESKMNDYKKSFKLNGNDLDIFTVTITRSKRSLVTESFTLDSVNSISALPSGSPCGCCNGSGKMH